MTARDPRLTRVEQMDCAARRGPLLLATVEGGDAKHMSTQSGVTSAAA
jgi:hypothetical protein